MDAVWRDGTLFRRLLESIKDLVTDGNLFADGMGLRLQEMDTYAIALVQLQLREAAFERYRCHSSGHFGVNLATLLKRLRSAPSDSTLRTFVDRLEDPDWMTFQFTSDDPSAKPETYTCRLTKYDTIPVPVPETDYDVVVTMSSAEFQRSIKEACEFADVLELAVDANAIRFTVNGDLTTATILHKIEPADLTRHTSYKPLLAATSTTGPSKPTAATRQPTAARGVGSRPAGDGKRADTCEPELAPARQTAANRPSDAKSCTREGSSASGSGYGSGSGSGSGGRGRKRLRTFLDEARGVPISESGFSDLMREAAARKRRRLLEEEDEQNEEEEEEEEKKTKGKGQRRPQIRETAVSLGPKAANRMVRQRFPAAYLACFAKASVLSDTVRLYLAEEEPMLVEFVLPEDAGLLRFYIAQKYDPDDHDTQMPDTTTAPPNPTHTAPAVNVTPSPPPLNAT